MLCFEVDGKVVHVVDFDGADGLVFDCETYALQFSSLVLSCVHCKVTFNAPVS